MKYFILVVLVLVVVGSILVWNQSVNAEVDGLKSNVAFKVDPEDSDYIAHEWGTFTSLHGSDGTMLAGLDVEEERLPSFVKRHTFSIAPKNAMYSFKGMMIALKNVTVKMETPVIYFYSDKARKVRTDVYFNGGSISEWYPQRQRGETIGTLQSELDFKNRTQGFIGWDVEVLSPDAQEPLSFAKEESKTWISPRATDANKIKIGKDVEKFLFYRGMGNFKLPLELKRPEDGQLNLKNNGDAIPFALVYEKREGEKPVVWWTGKLDKEQVVSIARPDQTVDFEKVTHPSFIQNLVQAGLFEKEAASMLATWQHSYFEKPGLKVFWILPENKTNQILPVNLSPKPKEFKRVLVGRSEILSPEFEAELLDAHKNENLEPFYEDRFYKAYLERIAQLQNTAEQ